jgi:hypothetical protein
LFALLAFAGQRKQEIPAKAFRLQLSEMPEALFGQDNGQEIEDENVEGELLKTRLTAIVAMG